LKPKRGEKSGLSLSTQQKKIALTEGKSLPLLQGRAGKKKKKDQVGGKGGRTRGKKGSRPANRGEIAKKKGHEGRGVTERKKGGDES